MTARGNYTSRKANTARNTINEVTYENNAQCALRPAPPGGRHRDGGFGPGLDRGGHPYRSLGAGRGGPRLLLRQPRPLRELDPAPELRLGLGADRRLHELAPLRGRT